MEPAKPVLKSLAVASPVILVGAFVGYCSGHALLMSGSKSNQIFQFKDQPAPQSPPSQSPQPGFMSGSKSTFIFVGNGVRPPETPLAAATGDPNPPAPPMIPPAKP